MSGNKSMTLLGVYEHNHSSAFIFLSLHCTYCSVQWWDMHEFYKI